MKKDFFAYLRIEEAELKKIWKNSIFHLSDSGQLFPVLKTLLVWLFFSTIIISAQAQLTPDDSKGFTARL